MAKDMKRPRTSDSSKGGSSLLTGLLVGLVIGIGVAVGVALYINRGANPFSGKATPAPASRPAVSQPSADQAPEILRPTGSKDEVAPQINSASAPAQKASGTDRFDFYTMLPGLAEKGGNKPAVPQEASKPAKIEPQKGAYLQAGSFQNERDADNLKAKLALIGIEARIQTQDIPEKGIWHRVRIGPFGNPADLEKSRTQLQANGVETVIVKNN